jgi:hypothetical protein
MPVHHSSQVSLAIVLSIGVMRSLPLRPREHPGLDLLALVACGDVEPTRWKYVLSEGEDNAREFMATGYREQFLSAGLLDPSKQSALAAQVVPLGVGTIRQIEAPSPFQLALLIKSANTLSQTDPVARIRACYGRWLSFFQ